MFAPVPAVGYDDSAGHMALVQYSRGTSAVSSEALAVKEAAFEVVEYTEWSQVLFGEKSALLSTLRDLAIECNEPDWDGAGANALDPRAILNTENFIRALPVNIAMPELAPEPDGSISLDWIQSRHRLFSVSVGPGARIAYAWLDGSESGHAVAPFDGDTIPTRVIEGIRGIMNHGKTTVWPFWQCR